MKLSSKTIFRFVIFMSIIGTQQAKGDWWSDTRDGIFGNKDFTEPAKSTMDKVNFRNLSIHSIDLVVADQKGQVNGWYTIEGGGERTLEIHRGQFYLHAHNSKGEVQRFSGSVSRIPVTNSAFSLKYNPDQTLSTTIDNKYRGTFARQVLPQLGFSERDFYQLSTSLGVNFHPSNETANAGVTTLKPPTILPPFSLGKLRFELTSANNIKTYLIQQPNNTWDAWEGSRHVVFRSLASPNGFDHLINDESGIQMMINRETNQLYVAKKGETAWTLVGNGVWKQN